MQNSLTQNIQDYLKTIYALTENGGAASTTELACRLGLSPASITGMVQRLAGTEPALVIYRKHQGVILTEAGRLAALETLRHHRLLETYLTQALGYTWDEVHDEACRLEHFISEELEARIAARLGNPQRDPHGDPIPAADLSLPPDSSLPLTALRPPQQGRLLRVKTSDSALLRHLAGLGLLPGNRLSVLSYSDFDRTWEIKIENLAPKTLGEAVCQQLFVEEVGKEEG